MRQKSIETKLAKGLTIGGLTALGLLTMTGCGNERPTPQTISKVTSNDKPLLVANPNSAKLNMALDLCANEAINSKIKEVTHMALTCVKSIDTSQGSSSSNTESEAYSWYDSATSKMVIKAILQHYPANDRIIYDVEKTIGGKDEPLGSTPCVLIRYKDQNVNNYDCFVSEHYYASIIDGSGFQFPISTYQSISRLVIAEASK